MEADQKVREETRAKIREFLICSDFGKRYYQEVCATVFKWERWLQTAQFVLSSGALLSLTAGVNPLWPQISALFATVVSATLLGQKLSRSSTTAAQLQEGWTDLHRESELLWARLGGITEEQALLDWQKLSLEEKALDSRATQAFPASRFAKIRKECWDATLRDRNLQTSA